MLQLIFCTYRQKLNYFYLFPIPEFHTSFNYGANICHCTGHCLHRRNFRLYVYSVRAQSIRHRCIRQTGGSWARTEQLIQQWALQRAWRRFCELERRCTGAAVVITHFLLFYFCLIVLKQSIQSNSVSSVFYVGYDTIIFRELQT